MMIRNIKNPVTEALQQYLGSEGARNDANRPVTGAAASAITETVELSSQAKEIRQIRAALANSPDVREDKVTALKREIESGKYQIQPDAVANKMIDESLIDIFA